jgi:ABC-type multidrug transport system fused ATPase/permease subunit
VLRAVKLGAGQATTIQVAHRLPAIVGSDRVLVMERGIAAEVGEPSELLRDPQGRLSKMVESLGAAAARSLRDRFFEAAAVKKKAG